LQDPGRALIFGTGGSSVELASIASTWLYRENRGTAMRVHCLATGSPMWTGLWRGLGVLAAPRRNQTGTTTPAQRCLTCQPGHARRGGQGYSLPLTQGLASRLARAVPRRLKLGRRVGTGSQLAARRYITAARLAATVAAVATGRYGCCAQRPAKYRLISPFVRLVLSSAPPAIVPETDSRPLSRT
jgi:hypothetical protein